VIVAFSRDILEIVADDEGGECVVKNINEMRIRSGGNAPRIVDMALKLYRHLMSAIRRMCLLPGNA
jgi:hypothetical protein